MKYKTQIILSCSLSLVIACLSPLYTKAQQVLSLEQCEQMATQRNNQLKAATEDVNAAKARQAQQNATGKPFVNGSVTGFYFGKPLNRLIPEYGISPGVGISQPIYAGGKIRLGKEMAEKGVEIQQEQKVLATTEVLFATERAYWLVVAALEQIRLAQQYKKQLAALYNDLNNQFNAGTIYKNDVLRAQVQQNGNELDMVRAQDNLTMAKLTLAQIIGLGDSTGFTVADSLDGHFDIPGDELLLQQALIDRPEIRIFKKVISTEELQQKILAADLKPGINVALNGLTAFGKAGIKPGTNENFMATWYSMLSVNVPIFEWGRKKKKLSEQQFKISSEQYQLKEREEQITLEVQQAYLRLGQSIRRIELSDSSLRQAAENLRLSNDRFKAGTIVGKDVLEAQTIWQQAKSNLLEAKVQYKIDAAAYRKTIGTSRRVSP